MLLQYKQNNISGTGEGYSPENERTWKAEECNVIC